MRWSELPEPARRYILYHVATAPLLFAWYMLPYSLVEEGYTAVQLGALYAAVNVASLPARILVGRYFTFHDVKKGLAFIDVLEAASLLLLYFATGGFAVLVAGVALLLSKVAGILHPLYQAYERAVYPEDRLKDALVWHMLLPEASAAISYPLLGYALSALRPGSVREGFLALAVAHVALAIYVLALFYPVTLKEGEEGSLLDDLRKLAGALGGRLRLYLSVELLYLLAWQLTPAFVLVNYVVEEYGGNLFHVALFEASMSAASVASMLVVDRVPTRLGFRAMALSAAGVSASMLLLSAKPPLWALMVLGFALRMFDSAFFVFSRAWLYGSIAREEAALVSSGLSALSSTVLLAVPLLAGLLAAVSPGLPYLAGSFLVAATLPLIAEASKSAGQARPRVG